MSHPLVGRRLYLCTADRPDLEAFVAACIDGGVDVVQLRDKVLDARACVERARACRRVCHDHGVPFLLNDRPDLALEAEADGVHVGQDDVRAATARRILGPDALIGLSTHGPDDLAGALDQPVDYLSAGPVEPTPTKPGRPGTGLAYAGAAAADVAAPGLRHRRRDPGTGRRPGGRRGAPLRRRALADRGGRPPSGRPGPAVAHRRSAQRRRSSHPMRVATARGSARSQRPAPGTIRRSTGPEAASANA